MTPRPRSAPAPTQRRAPGITVTLDAGALIAFENREPWVIALLDVFMRGRDHILAVPTGAIAQAYRRPATQAALNRLLRHSRVEIVPLDLTTARAAGALCAARGTSDVVDASVVLCARLRCGRVATTDPRDLLALDPALVVIPPPP